MCSHWGLTIFSLSCKIWILHCARNKDANPNIFLRTICKLFTDRKTFVLAWVFTVSKKSLGLVSLYDCNNAFTLCCSHDRGPYSPHTLTSLTAPFCFPPTASLPPLSPTHPSIDPKTILTATQHCYRMWSSKSTQPECNKSIKYWEKASCRMVHCHSQIRW